MKQVSASILSANWLCLGEDLKRAEAAGCDCIHVDVTDGHFVSNLTMGMDITRAVCKATSLRVDVHLMIAEPGDSSPRLPGRARTRLPFMPRRPRTRLS